MLSRPTACAVLTGQPSTPGRHARTYQCSSLRRVAAVRGPQRQRAYSALMFLGPDGKDQTAAAADAPASSSAVSDSAASDSAASDSASCESTAAELIKEVVAIKERMDSIEAQVIQMNDRARDRAVSLAAAVRAAGDGESGPMEQLQHQQDQQLEQDEKSWDSMMDTFTQLMSKGYIQSTEKIRDRLLISEWELARRAVAMRRGVAQFELHCAAEKVPLEYDVLSQLYQEPDQLGIIEDKHLRMQARASINQAVDEEYMKVWAHCTAEAQKLAQQFSNTDFISKIMPESGVLDALKKVVPTVMKLVV